MNILVFCNADLAKGGGSAIRARLIAEGFVSCGAKVFVVAVGVPSEFNELCIGSMLFTSPRDDRRSILLDAVKLFKPDIVYGITEAYADIVADISRNFNIPYAFDLHGLGFIEVLELGVAYPHRRQRVIDSLRWLSNIPRANIITVANPTLLPVVRCLNRRAEGIIGITNVNHFTPEGASTRLGNDRSSVQFLYAGNFFVWQGLGLLFEAINRILPKRADCEFTILGSIGRQKVQIDKLQRGFPVSRVHFHDSVNFSFMPEFYRGADVLVLPRPRMWSTYLAFPQKLVDYMASGRTVLATDLKPHAWALLNPEAGILCPPTVVGLAEGICEAVSLNNRERMGANARALAVEKFCHLRQSKRILGLFESVIQQHRG